MFSREFLFDSFRLASYRNARRGQCFAFTDVEGVVRRSRLLSSERAVGGMGASLPLPAIESSEEEYALCAATGCVIFWKKRTLNGRKVLMDGYIYIYVWLYLYILVWTDYMYIHIYIYICLHFSYDIFIITYWYHFSWHRFMHSTWMTCTMQHTVVVQKIRKELSNWCAQAREQNAIL